MSNIDFLLERSWYFLHLLWISANIGDSHKRLEDADLRCTAKINYDVEGECNQDPGGTGHSGMSHLFVK
jgi:hypothetical protein